MYIAFKWLLILTLLMWLVLCFIDLVVKRLNEDKSSDQPVWFYRTVPKNTTDVVAKSQKDRRFRVAMAGPRQRHCDVALLHYLMFFSGAVAGAVYNRKKLFLSYAQSRFANIVTKICKLSSHFRPSDLNIDLPKLNKTAIQISVASLEILLKMWEFLKIMFVKYQNRSKAHENCYKLNLLLLKKVKEIAEERNKLGNILIAAIKANKTLKMRYKVQGIAKSHLVRHIEDVQKHIKENRAKYNAFYQHHILIQQENAFLKSFVKKLQEEKYEAQRSLMSLVDLIYLSKNSELQAYCTQHIVHSAGGVASSNANVTAEIQKILCKIRPETSGKKPGDKPGVRVGTTRSWTSTRITEAIPEEESLVPLKPDGPKLRGLPGEYVWTVKDKNGLIEKLYEYECRCNFDNLDTIQRIREYSVYHDKDCLLDFSKCREDSSRQKFLTESRHFQDFLKNNSENLVATTTCPRPQLKLLSG